MIQNPYLIQRGTIRRPRAEPDARLSQAVDFEYMGSSEFEFGALPRSFRNIEAKKDSWKRHLVNEIKSGEATLRVYGSFEEGEFEEYKQHLLALRAGKARTMESTFFEANRDPSVRAKTDTWIKTDFWWDIDNDVMFGFYKVFMNDLPTYVVNSLIYMNEQKEKR